MPVLYQKAREKIIAYSNTDMISYFDYRQLGDRFKELNPDLFLDEETPEHIKDKYYNHDLYLKDFSNNMEYFRGKKVAQAFSSSEEERKMVSLYGDSIYII